MANEMEYRQHESSYVGQASDGTWVRVDADEFAESVQEALESEDISHDDPRYDERYAYWQAHLLHPDEWIDLIGVNPNVTEA